MATNRIHEDGDQIAVETTDPTTASSGDAVLCGSLPGVAMNDTDSDGVTVIQCNGVYDLSVEGHDGSTDSQVTTGSTVHYNTSDDTLDINTSNTHFGYALESVGSGSTETIKVKVGH